MAETCKKIFILRCACGKVTFATRLSVPVYEIRADISRYIGPSDGETASPEIATRAARLQCDWRVHRYRVLQPITPLRTWAPVSHLETCVSDILVWSLSSVIQGVPAVMNFNSDYYLKMYRCSQEKDLQRSFRNCKHRSERYCRSVSLDQSKNNI